MGLGEPNHHNMIVSKLVINKHGNMFDGVHLNDVIASGWQMSRWSKYIECVADGETKETNGLWLLCIFLHFLIHLVQCHDKLRLVSKFQVPVYEVVNIKEMMVYASGIQTGLCRTVVFHGWLSGVPQAHLLIILIILNWIFLFSFPSLCIIGTGFIFGVNHQ